MQAEVLRRLAASTEPIRFTDLKEDGIENGLFMYHTNKLIDRKLIEKSGQGFMLTAQGARWVNNADTSLMTGPVLPRLLVQCLIVSGDAYLVARRTGSLKQHLNQYMLPGGLHEYGMTANEVVALTIEELFNQAVPTPELLTVAEVIYSHEQDFIHHSVSHVFKLELPNRLDPKTNETYEYLWINKSMFDNHDPIFKDSQFIPELIEKLPGLAAWETFSYTD